jgi:PAS domain S-box-containing protein
MKVPDQTSKQENKWEFSNTSLDDSSKEPGSSELQNATDYLLLQSELRQKELEIENAKLLKTIEGLKKNELMLRRTQRIGKIAYFHFHYETRAGQGCSEFNELLGLDPDFVINPQNLGQLIDPSFHQIAQLRYQESLKKRKRFGGEYKIIRPNDGTERWLSCWARIEFDSDHQPVYLTCIIQDISEQKQILSSFKQSLKLVTIQNERLLDFSYIISHHLRSHYSNIEQLLDFLEKSTTKEEQKDILKHLKTVAIRFEDTLRNLNDVVCIQKNTTAVVKPLNLNAEVDKAIKNLADMILEKNALVSNNVAPEVFINYNPAFLENILQNFLSNALKYSHPDRQPLVMIDYFYEEGKAILQFKDNGLGIDLNKHGKKLFGMYQTFHRNADAKGLGLFISKSQIEAMGGDIEVISEIDQGSRFKIKLK